MSIDKSDPNVARETAVNPNRNVAVVGLMTDDKRILLVRTKRFPDHWQPIGGGVKAGDPSPQDALVRELREEVGLTINRSDLAFELTTPYDFGKGTVSFFTASLPPGSELKYDEGELTDWAWYNLCQSLSLQMFPATRTFINHLLSKTPHE